MSRASRAHHAVRRRFAGSPAAKRSDFLGRSRESRPVPPRSCFLLHALRPRPPISKEGRSAGSASPRRRQSSRDATSRRCAKHGGICLCSTTALHNHRRCSRMRPASAKPSATLSSNAASRSRRRHHQEPRRFAEFEADMALARHAQPLPWASASSVARPRRSSRSRRDVRH